jgi:hypothetical protein|tara:strand:- start:5061 stop:5387 length:327 start_codon:yes stop_codon:yes gene_type:complete
MRYADLFEISVVDSKVIDLLSILSSEGVNQIPLDALVKELTSMGVDVDDESLFDEITNLPIVNNIKDGTVYFNTASLQASNLNKVDPEKNKKKVKAMAKKQVDKELSK